MITQKISAPKDNKHIQALNNIAKFDTCIFCNRRAVVAVSVYIETHEINTGLHILACDEHLLKAAQERQKMMDMYK